MARTYHPRRALSTSDRPGADNFHPDPVRTGPAETWWVDDLARELAQAGPGPCALCDAPVATLIGGWYLCASPVCRRLARHVHTFRDFTDARRAIREQP